MERSSPPLWRIICRRACLQNTYWQFDVCHERNRLLHGVLQIKMLFPGVKFSHNLKGEYMKNKLLTALILAIILVALFVVPVLATDADVEYVPMETRQLFIQVYSLVMIV